MSDYMSLLDRKAIKTQQAGIRTQPELNGAMFPHQRHTTEFLLKAGHGAAFLDTGLGKSLIELEWGRVISEHINKPVIMFAPLAVSHQHMREAERFSIEANLARSQDDVRVGINISNYERLHLFDRDKFAGIILDESSIIKSFTGATTRALMEFAETIPFRLCATATPAPNDHMELGQHCQFLGIMPSNEMLARWFITDQTKMVRYRLKKHGVKPFWNWVASWSRCISKPSDLGYSDDGFVLPKKNEHHHIIEVDITTDTDGMLFRIPTTSATQIHKEKRKTAPQRAEKIAEIVAREPNEPWLIWCDTDYEADELMARIDDAVEVRGSMSSDTKERKIIDFLDGNSGPLVTKPRIAGFGLNLQHCARTAFVGLSFSYEQYYQAIRRFWRFGQKRDVDVHTAMAQTEEAIWNAVKRKAEDHATMKIEMSAAMTRAMDLRTARMSYAPTEQSVIPHWMQA